MKKIFLAALAAAALTMGFSSCSEKNAADYEMNVFLGVDVVSSDTAETKQIAETYIKALGITNQEEMTVKVTGKDSLDCVSTVAKKCAKAEKELEGQQWTDLSAVSVYTLAEKNSARIYTKSYGTLSDNGSRPLKSVFGYNVKNRGGHTATSMHVQAQSKGIWVGAEWPKKYPYYCDMNLNMSAGGQCVYAMFGQETISFKDLQAIVRADDHSEELNKYIADVLVMVSDDDAANFKEFHIGDITYKYAQGIYGDPVKWDLNYRAGGPYLYLFYSTDAVKLQRVIDIDECLMACSSLHNGCFWESHENFTIDEVGRGPWDVSTFVEGVGNCYGNVVNHGPDVDFNEGAGGAFIHMRADYISFEHLKNLEFDADGNAIK